MCRACASLADANRVMGAGHNGARLPPVRYEARRVEWRRRGGRRWRSWQRGEAASHPVGPRAVCPCPSVR
eukprot:1175997-Pleurochrysis_carterae.AAC.1